MSTTPTRNVIKALLDEWDRARRDFVGFLKEQPPEFFELNLEGNQKSVKGVMGHVAGAAYGLPQYFLKAMNKPVPEVKYPNIRTSTNLAEIWDALEDIKGFTEQCLAALNDQDLGFILVTWQKPTTAEFIMEHSIVHFLKHRRQLARAKAGELKTWK